MGPRGRWGVGREKEREGDRKRDQGEKVIQREMNREEVLFFARHIFYKILVTRHTITFCHPAVDVTLVHIDDK